MGGEIQWVQSEGGRLIIQERKSGWISFMLKYIQHSPSNIVTLSSWLIKQMEQTDKIQTQCSSSFSNVACFVFAGDL